jgi:hypothetical protein
VGKVCNAACWRCCFFNKLFKVVRAVCIGQLSSCGEILEFQLELCAAQARMAARTPQRIMSMRVIAQLSASSSARSYAGRKQVRLQCSAQVDCTRPPQDGRAGRAVLHYTSELRPLLQHKYSTAGSVMQCTCVQVARVCQDSVAGCWLVNAVTLL